MMRAIKAVTTYRGRDPRDFVLFAFGGSGGVHAVELARALGIKRIVIPRVAGVFSALGLLVANVEIGLARAFLCSTFKVPIEEINRAYRSLEEEVQSQLGYQPERITFHRLADLRYSGQAYELSIPVPIGEVTDQTIRQMEEAFEKEHEKTYGHCFPGHPKETVSLRVIGSVVPDDVHTINLRWRVDRKAFQETKEVFRKAYFGPEMGERNTPVLSSRDALGREFRPGPQIIEEYEGTIVITPDAQAALDEWGNILIDVSV
jgi:N-methylhydantoinase A